MTAWDTTDVIEHGDTSDLRDFLLARVAEDEAVARSYLHDDRSQRLGPVVHDVMVGALTACRERRLLILEHCGSRHAPGGCGLLLLLAAGYVGHPEFRDEWESLTAH
ncbi:DUF6221 family protein [Nocardioides sp. MAHUQ-72]|uniref:DUF6221 family protein n=1 Tax=unclassified Nocardioides TaxID=2615069 RepID=UPI003620B8F8